MKTRVKRGENVDENAPYCLTVIEVLKVRTQIIITEKNAQNRFAKNKETVLHQNDKSFLSMVERTVHQKML